MDKLSMLSAASSLIGKLLVSSLLYGTASCALAFALTFLLRKRAPPGIIAAIWTVAVVKFLVPIAPALPSRLFAKAQSASPLDFGLLANSSVDASANSSAPTLTLAMLATALLVVWLVVSACLALRALQRNLSLRRELARLDEAPEHIRERVARCAQSMGIRSPRVLIGAQSPFVSGLFRPRLVLPDLAAGEALEAMVLHELAHLKRRDPFFRFFQLCTAILFFFWPPLRLAIRRLEEAREQACDALVLEREVMPVRDYAQLLIDLHKRAALAPASALAMASRISQLEGRIDMILESKIPRTSRFTSALVGLFACVALAAGARASSLRVSSSDSPTARDQECEKLLEAAVVHAQTGKYEDAAGDLERCLELEPEALIAAHCNRNLAVVYAHLQRTDEAAELLKKYQPYCEPEECESIGKLIARWSKKPSGAIK